MATKTAKTQARIKLLQEDLNDKALEHYLSKDIVAIDCEMMGLNINRDRLCLVQIGDTDRNITLVQIAQGQSKATNLKKLLESKEQVKLFHYARTDLSWLKHWLNIEVKNVFCTKIASKLARTYSDKHGLKDLTKEVIGKDLNKNQQSSDWGNTEINKDQVQYAANDVIHLIDVYKKLRTMLEREGKWQLAEQCAKTIPLFAELDIRGYENIFEH